MRDLFGCQARTVRRSFAVLTILAIVVTGCAGPIVEKRGDLRLYFEGTVLHTGDGDYLLKATADIREDFPPSDTRHGMLLWRQGPDHEYLVRGIVGEQVFLRSQGKTATVIHVNYITRTK